MIFHKFSISIISSKPHSDRSHHESPFWQYFNDDSVSDTFDISACMWRSISTTCNTDYKKCCKHLGKKLAAAPSAVDLTRVFEYIEKFKREETTEKISSFGQISFETCETLSPSELDLQRLLRKRTQSAYSIYEVTGQQATKTDFTAGL